MGIYDEVVCEYPLPDGYDATGIVFQTKDLGGEFVRWTIREDGRLLTPEGDVCWWDVGIVRLIYSNMLACGRGLVCSFDDSPPTLWTYRFHFQRGQVIGVEGGAAPASGTHVPREWFWKQVDGQPTWNPHGGSELPSMPHFDDEVEK